MYNDKRIIEKDLSNPEEALDRMAKIYSGQYKELFETAGNLLERPPTTRDYYDLYVWCLNRITYILCQNIYLVGNGEFEHISYNKEMSKYKELRKNLDELFAKFIGIGERQDKKLEKVINKFYTYCLEKDKKAENHYFMDVLKNDFPIAHNAVKIGLSKGIIEFTDDEKFNFKCDKGCVGLVFKQAGCTDYKMIKRFILMNDKKPADNTLRNCTKNTPPDEWEKLKTVFFPKTPKQPRNSTH
ncbi:MAG: hypothetical protein FWG29_05590 [Treponema sp.]|nr:hypothetical protein [Treponema sp.]